MQFIRLLLISFVTVTFAKNELVALKNTKNLEKDKKSLTYEYSLLDNEYKHDQTNVTTNLILFYKQNKLFI